MILSPTQLAAPSDSQDAGSAGNRRSWRPMVNKVILVGNLGRDPEVRSLPSGQPVASFGVATSRRWKDRDGNRQEQTEWHNVVCFGKQAEIAGQYLTKGKQVFVEGRIQTRSWDDKNSGEKKYRTEIVCENFQMLGGRGGEGGGRGGGAGGGAGGPPPPQEDQPPHRRRRRGRRRHSPRLRERALLRRRQRRRRCHRRRGRRHPVLRRDGGYFFPVGAALTAAPLTRSRAAPAARAAG